MQNSINQNEKDNKLKQILINLQKDFNLSSYIGIELEFYLQNVKNLNLLEEKIGYALKEEKGYGQYEIDFPPSSNILNYLKHIEKIREEIKHQALKQGGKAIFSSKPAKNDYGNAMHVHLNFLEDQDIEKYAKILCHYLAEDLPIFLPRKVDYTRLEAKFMAPTHICYGGNNRSVAIRIISHPNKRLEHRVPAANADLISVVCTILNSIYQGLKSPDLMMKFNKIYGNASDQQYKLKKIMPN